LLLAEEDRARRAIQQAIDTVGTACEEAADALRRGGRVIYAGAGTSGRLGVLDAAEMPPTFGADPGRIVALIAGGGAAVTKSIEGAEDDRNAGASALLALRPTAADYVVGITMSGTAAYVGGVLDAARGRRALVTANPSSTLRAETRIVLDLGAELLAGSTRLKGGSATKVVLNMISTAAMAGSGAVYGNLMVRVRPVNRKLRDRAERLVMRLTGLERDAAAPLLRDAEDDVCIAALMARKRLDRASARAALDAAGGNLRRALA
ncbi:MAG: N-acetylmuramic acid 6-phosphate etherase, partial [Planctomycetota bacterium]|nr:N-acetylmuramic acid 6-phosphate etherase [Planctomycetota bacterium]